MTERTSVAIVGSGPAGLAAAGRAARRGLSHVLLEKAAHHSDTIQRFQKGKLVMASPEILPLRSDLSFAAGSREGVLDAWSRQIGELGIRVRYGSDVTAIRGTKGDFTLTLAGGEGVAAEHVVLAIGVQGNARKLQVPGAGWERVQYQLDDPGEYEDETIVVVGAGDAAIENALALSVRNRVVVVNRRDEFARAKAGNLTAIDRAIAKREIECFYNSAPARIEPGKIFLETSDGVAELTCDRVIARLGADPPRKFLQACGIRIASEEAGSLPELSASYESSVPGLYVVGALAGYPLIKQAMNQGYEVIETILGSPVPPADEPILQKKIERLGGLDVEGFLAQLRRSVPLLAEVNPLMLREVLLDSDVRLFGPGDVIFRRNEYATSVDFIVSGEVGASDHSGEGPDAIATMGPGDFFGEMALLSGRRRSATVSAHTASVIVETGRRTMLRLIQSVPKIHRSLDRAALVRQLRTYVATGLSSSELEDVVSTATFKTLRMGEALFEEGEPGDGLHLIRRGSVVVSRRVEGREVVLSYVAAGNYVGEMALLRDTPRSASVRAAVNGTETVKLETAPFKALLDRHPAVRAQIDARIRDRLLENVRMEARPEAGGLVKFLVGQGVGEATDVLLIDESLCVACDNCEKACAETHGGTSRLDREAGATFARIHVPTSCRHCEHPHCMKDCPPDAIHRAPSGEVFINDSCIGCGNCERNCPYDVIQMAPVVPPKKPGFLQWLLFGRGPGPGADLSLSAYGGQKVAVKCDLCRTLRGGPACVRSCPTGAAMRVSPERYLAIDRLAAWRAP